jgi:hypothetical protein
MGVSWLPAELADGPFSVTAARADAMPSWRLRDRALHLPTRAVRAVAPPSTPEQRARAFAVALPDDVAFSHVSACQLWGLDLPGQLEATTELDVMRSTRHAQIRRRGCRGHRGLELRSTAVVRGLRVTGLADTWVDLGELAGDGVELEDLVVIGDQVATRLTGRPEVGSTAATADRGRRELAAALSARCRPRGKVVLGEALDLVRSPVRSPMETRARLMFLRAGFPEPAVNRAVFHRDGSWLLEGDLVWEDERVIGEYQGSDHASIRRRSHDASRQALAEDEGWRLLQIFAEDVYRPARRVDCLRRFAAALGLDPARLTIR